jgi:hypothetical protein
MLLITLKDSCVIQILKIYKNNNFFKKIIFNISSKNIKKKLFFFKRHFYIKNKEGLNLRPPWIILKERNKKDIVFLLHFYKKDKRAAYFLFSYY